MSSLYQNLTERVSPEKRNKALTKLIRNQFKNAYAQIAQLEADIFYYQSMQGRPSAQQLAKITQGNQILVTQEGEQHYLYIESKKENSYRKINLTQAAPGLVNSLKRANAFTKEPTYLAETAIEEIEQIITQRKGNTKKIKKRTQNKKQLTQSKRLVANKKYQGIHLKEEIHFIDLKSPYLSEAERKLAARLFEHYLAKDTKAADHEYRLLPYTLYQLEASGDQPAAHIVLSHQVNRRDAKKDQTNKLRYDVIEQDLLAQQIFQNARNYVNQRIKAKHKDKPKEYQLIKKAPDGFASGLDKVKDLIAVQTKKGKNIVKAEEKQFETLIHHHNLTFKIEHGMLVKSKAKAGATKEEKSTDKDRLEAKSKKDQLLADVANAESSPTLGKREPVLFAANYKNAVNAAYVARTEAPHHAGVNNLIPYNENPHQKFITNLNYGEILFIGISLITSLQDTYRRWDAHSDTKDYVHGDVKGNNVVYDNKAESLFRAMKVIDFDYSNKPGLRRISGNKYYNPNQEYKIKYEKEFLPLIQAGELTKAEELLNNYRKEYKTVALVRKSDGNDLKSQEIIEIEAFNQSINSIRATLRSSRIPDNTANALSNKLNEIQNLIKQLQSSQDTQVQNDLSQRIIQFNKNNNKLLIKLPADHNKFLNLYFDFMGYDIERLSRKLDIYGAGEILSKLVKENNPRVPQDSHDNGSDGTNLKELISKMTHKDLEGQPELEHVKSIMCRNLLQQLTGDTSIISKALDNWIKALGHKKGILVKKIEEDGRTTYKHPKGKNLENIISDLQQIKADIEKLHIEINLKSSAPILKKDYPNKQQYLAALQTYVKNTEQLQEEYNKTYHRIFDATTNDSNISHIQYHRGSKKLTRPIELLFAKMGCRKIASWVRIKTDTTKIIGRYRNFFTEKAKRSSCLSSKELESLTTTLSSSSTPKNGL